jgi:two-component system, LytTR family, sensor kinase
MIWAGKHTVKNEPFLHLVFWTSWVVLFSLLQSYGQGSVSLFLWSMYYLITLPVFVLHTYLLAYWLVPKTFLMQRYGLFAAGTLVMLVVFSIVELVVSNELVFKLFSPGKAFGPGYLNLKNIIISGIGNHYIILVFMAIKVGKAWYSASNMEKKEQLRNLETGLEIYHYQLHPRIMLHLMEVLGYSIRQNSLKTPDIIIQISGFLNRFLKEIPGEGIHLTEEIKLIQSFLKIHAEALGGKLKSNFTISGNFDSFIVPSFLFLPLIDSALQSSKRCNKIPECAVFMKAEENSFQFFMELWSDKKIECLPDNDRAMMHQQIQRYFPGNFSIQEKKDTNYWQLQVDVFPYKHVTKSESEYKLYRKSATEKYITHES